MAKKEKKFHTLGSIFAEQLPTGEQLLTEEKKEKMKDSLLKSRTVSIFKVRLRGILQEFNYPELDPKTKKDFWTTIYSFTSIYKSIKEKEGYPVDRLNLLKKDVGRMSGLIDESDIPFDDKLDILFSDKRAKIES